MTVRPNRGADRRRNAVLVALALVVPMAGLHASQSNRFVGELATAALPPDVPAFLRRPAVVQDTGELVREPDRLRGTGTAYDAAHTPDHFFVLDDDGHTRTGIKVTELPATREEYIVGLHARGTSLAKEGASYYALLEGWELLRQDFAYWRVASAAAKAWKDPRQLAWLKGELRRREALIVRDIGMLGHTAQDVAAPLHVSIHNEAWRGDPSRGYTTQPFRRRIEGAYFLANVRKDQVRAFMPPPRPCKDPIPSCVAVEMLQTLKQVEPTYRLATSGGFEPGRPEGVAFMAQLAGRQAGFTRDLIVKAWRESLDRTINYPPMEVKVRDVEAGQVPTFAQLHGWD